VSLRSIESVEVCPPATVVVSPAALADTAIAATRRRLAVETFLSVPLPANEDLFETEDIRFLGQSDLEQLLLERAPFFFIGRAVAFGKHTVFGLARMTVDEVPAISRANRLSP
jgi:hypothetical protein